MRSVIPNGFRRTALAAFVGAALVAGLGLISPDRVQAATLYISEFRTGVTNAPGSDQAQIPPQAALTDQTVALSGTTAISAAFNSKTNAVMLMCDEGCSVSFGTSSVTATTSNYLLQQGVPYVFGAVPSGFVAAIANSAGNTAGGGGAAIATNSTIVSPLDANGNVKESLYDSSGVALTYNANGQATMANSAPVVIASNQTANALWGQGAVAAAVPANAVYMGANSAGNLTGLIQANASVAISVATGTTTQIVALSGSTKIYVTHFDVISAGTGNITFEYGTGSSCGTGTTVLTGAYNLTAQAGISAGGGLGPILVVPAGNALCILTTASVQMSGSVAYTQF